MNGRRANEQDAAARAVRVLVVGQTPPPIGGQALAIRRLLDGPVAGVQMSHVRMGFSRTMKDMGRPGLRKILHLLAVILKIYHRRFIRRPRILYYPPSGPHLVPVLRDMAVLLSTRWLFEKTVLHFHASGISELYPRLPRPLQFLFRRAFYHADAAIRPTILPPNDAAYLQARREYIVPYGIDDHAQEPKGRSVSVDGNDEFRVLFAAILCESKGYFIVLEACGLLWDRGIPVRLELMGQHRDAAAENRARALTERLGLEGRVTWLGVLRDRQMRAAFERADVFCLPTFFESEAFGIVFVDAMCHGIPVVATRWRGIPEVVEDGRTGFLVEPRDVEAVADRLACLARDPQLRSRMGAAGRQKFLREYRADVFLRRMAAVFHEVAEGRVSPKSNLAAAIAGGESELTQSRALRDAGASPQYGSDSPVETAGS